MSDTVIRVENLGKKYIIGHQKQERYTALWGIIDHSLEFQTRPQEVLGLLMLDY